MKKALLILAIIAITTVGVVIGHKDQPASTTPVDTHSPFLYTFNVDGELQESGSMGRSASPYWWLNSGGVMKIKRGVGSTNKGNLPPLSRWRVRYNLSNPTDTDNGYHPQNIFRLVTRTQWGNFSEEALFRIEKINESSSPNRNVSNGLLFFLRYLDGNNLYYAGLRVDGTAVIKKKINGEYFTLSQKKIYEGDYTGSNPHNLLPMHSWLGLRAEIESRADKSVIIKLFVKEGDNGEWKNVLEAEDDPGGFDGSPILDKGFAGIRTDFMDVEFRDFKITTI